MKIKKRLEKNNIIWGYVALTDYQNISLQHFTVLFKRTTTPLNKVIVEGIKMTVCNVCAQNVPKASFSNYTITNQKKLQYRTQLPKKN